MRITSLTIENIKCFGDQQNIIKDIGDVNIFIGENNTGKSTILEVLEFIFWFKQVNPQLNITNPRSLIHDQKEGLKPKITLEVQFSDGELVEKLKFEEEYTFNINRRGVTIRDFRKLMKNQTFLLEIDLLESITKRNDSNLFLTFKLKENNSMNEMYEPEVITSINRFISSDRKLKQRFLDLLKEHESKYIPAYRAIKEEQLVDGRNACSDGDGITQLFYEYLNYPDHDKKVINKIVRDIIEVVFPKMNIEYFSTKIKKVTEEIEIYIDNKQGVELPLRNLGAGIRNLIIFIVNLTLDIKENSIICIDEPENNFHPSLQRIFYSFLTKLAKDKKVQIFISTHSTYFLSVDEIKNVYRTTLDDNQAKIFQCNPKIYENLEEFIKILRLFKPT